MERDADDPKGLIRESYRIEGIGMAECRSIFLDWALSLPDGADAGAGELRRAQVGELLQVGVVVVEHQEEPGADADDAVDDAEHHQEGDATGAGDVVRLPVCALCAGRRSNGARGR